MAQIAMAAREGAQTMARGVARRASYVRQVTGILAISTTLSIAYSLYTVFAFGADTLRNPAFYVVYGIWLALILLVRVDKRWSWLTVAIATGLMLLIGVFYYPTVFVPAQQDTIGWFENDAYMGLLLLAEYLCIQRLRGVTIAPEA